MLSVSLFSVRGALASTNNGSSLELSTKDPHHQPARRPTNEPNLDASLP